MGDHLTAAERSQHMRKIRKTDTKPELQVRRVAHSLGYRFRLNRRDLPGTPDLVFPRLRKVIFVHGCFWHQHPGCALARLPKSRHEYWLPKLRRNQERDKAARWELERRGWSVGVIWECETKDEQELAGKIAACLSTGCGATNKMRKPKSLRL